MLQSHSPRIRQHDEFQRRRRLVVMQFIFICAIGDKRIVFAAELADHIAQAIYGAKHQAGIVGLAQGRCCDGDGIVLGGSAAAASWTRA
jgi:hypothetical protein